MNSFNYGPSDEVVKITFGPFRKKLPLIGKDIRGDER